MTKAAVALGWMVLGAILLFAAWYIYAVWQFHDIANI